MFNKLVIIGVGLIGGSLALAARQAGIARKIIGVGRNQENLSEAIRLGVIDHQANSLETIRDADCILLAMPVGQMASVMQSIQPFLSEQVVITDVGSTKSDVILAAKKNLGDKFKQFVPGHPIAGAEKSGVTAAKTELFKAKNVVLTPCPETRIEATQKITTLWESAGAKVSEMSAETHDAVFAAVSHLPHLLAFALVEEIAQRPDAAQLFNFAAGGFRDFSRIASSSPEMWRDISLANRDALLNEIDAYQSRLSDFRQMLEQKNSAALVNTFEHARSARENWLASLPNK